MALSESRLTQSRPLFKRVPEEDSGARFFFAALQRNTPALKALSAIPQKTPSILPSPGDPLDDLILSCGTSRDAQPPVPVASLSFMNLPSSSLQSVLPPTLPLSNLSNLSNGHELPDKKHPKLHLLREHDTERTWETLDDQRVCLLCGSEFTGAQIRIRVERARAKFECPDAACRGGLAHFVYAGNPLLSEASWSDYMRVKSTAQPNY